MKKQIRCTIYTRKSTDEGLEQDFNSLDAQREACEAYIKSQKHKGWTLLTKKTMMADIQAEQWIVQHSNDFCKILKIMKLILL